MKRRILLLPGDGIGPEVVREAKKVLEVVESVTRCNSSSGRLISAAQQLTLRAPLTRLPLKLQREKQMRYCLEQWVVHSGTVSRQLGGPSGVVGDQGGSGSFCNLRPALLFPELAGASSLRAERVAGLDVLIVRELTGGIYFGEPRGISVREDGVREGINTDRYDENEIRRIGRLAFEAARKRGGRLCSVDKANVLEVTMLWREVMESLRPEFPDVSLSHMYVDNAAMQLVREPKQFDVIVTGNLFGDILSDTAAMLTGSIGMLPSASLNASSAGLYEPVHGSAPDIAGEDKANPLATILSAAMLMRYSLDESEAANDIERAVADVLSAGKRTGDIATDEAEEAVMGTRAMGDAVVSALSYEGE